MEYLSADRREKKSGIWNRFWKPIHDEKKVALQRRVHLRLLSIRNFQIGNFLSPIKAGINLSRIFVLQLSWATKGAFAEIVISYKSISLLELLCFAFVSHTLFVSFAWIWWQNLGINRPYAPFGAATVALNCSSGFSFCRFPTKKKHVLSSIIDLSRFYFGCAFQNWRARTFFLYIRS